MKRSNQIGWAQVRGGVFIFLALLFFAGGVLLMGQKTKMFVSKGDLRIVMNDVVGLKIGAPVWLAGVDVGLVTGIFFANPKDSNEVSIDIEVDTDALKKIGVDSKVTIKTRGLMGEKYVDILPSKQYSETPPTLLKGTPVARLDDVIQKAGDAFDRVNGIIDNIEIRVVGCVIGCCSEMAPELFKIASINLPVQIEIGKKTFQRLLDGYRLRIYRQPAIMQQH